ncbi:MAG: glycosyltransferase family 4 protein [Candidatus Eisenbacteria bacterium]|nr:glycosyltransferase family 4 protein [Candidatus Eisenbacteria bacterium]
MKIAMIGQKGVPATYGGVERHVEELSRRLVQRGHEISVYSRMYYTAVRGRHHGVRILRLPSVNTKHLDAATHCLISTVDSLFRNFDVVHFHALGPSLLSFLPRLRGTGTVVTVHGLDWQREKWGPPVRWFLRQCEYPAVAFPDRTIVVSRDLQKHFKERFRRQTTVIPNGTNVPVPRPASKILKFGLEPDKYVLFVGRLVPEKGVHLLVEAFRRIPGDMKLAIAGGSSFSEDYVSKLMEYRSDRILLLDYVFGDVLEELWSNAHFVVQPSTMEGLSISLIEAMSYGKCVLTSDIPANMEVVEDCAVPFQSNNVEDLEGKLRHLLGHPEVVHSFEEKCRTHVVNRFSWDRIVDQTESLYREVARRR